MGLLVKLDGTGTNTTMDPFKEAVAVIDAVRDYSKFFSCGSRIDELHKTCALSAVLRSSLRLT